jgi:hypothetical protein
MYDEQTVVFIQHVWVASGSKVVVNELLEIHPYNYNLHLLRMGAIWIRHSRLPHLIFSRH